MIINRIADIFLIIGICFCFIYFKTLDYVVIFSLVPHMFNIYINLFGFSFKLLNIINICFLIGAMGKSAQIGLHIWLPDAMEGPTPVSSLLHAATMVTAGIFLLLRCSIFIEYSIISAYICFIGIATALFFAIVSSFQYDIKKIIAYSTCSQLGYMFFSCGISQYQIVIFHLFNHAFFKALLFLGAGSIIHALSDEQDIRKMGNLVKRLPFTYICLVIGSLAIVGFPFLTGFYSKDIILELALSRYILDGYFIYSLAILTAYFTSVYSCRLLLIVFYKNINSFYKNYIFVEECGIEMFLSLFLLTFITIFIGFVSHDLFIGSGTYMWGNTLYTSSTNFCFTDIHFLPA